MANTSVSAEIVVLEQAPTEVLIVTVAERGASSVEAVAIHAADPAAHGIAATVATAIAAHSIDADPHAGYALEADLGTAAFLDAGTSVGDLVQVQAGGALPALDASALLNLPESGISQGAADLLYAPIAKGVTGGDSHNHDGGDGAQIAYASLSGLPTLGTAAAAATGDFEASGTVSTHNAVTTAHGISAFGSTLVDDADAATARATLSVPSGSGTSTGTNTGDETTTRLGALITGATSKSTPVDADRLALWDSVTSLLQYLSWANLKTALSSIFVLLAGKAGGQKIIGGTGTADSLDLQSTSGVGTTGAQVRILVGNNGGTQAVTVLNSGDVGVGTGSPTKKLDVNGSVGISSNLLLNSPDYNDHLIIRRGLYGYDTIITGTRIDYSPTVYTTDFKFLGNLETTGRLKVTGNAIVDGSVGAGAPSPSAKIHAISTTEQLRLGYDAANYYKSGANSVGLFRVDLVGTAPAIIHAVSDATTNSVYSVSTLSKNSTGAGAVGLGVRQVLAAKSSTTNDVQQVAVSSEWLVATHATRSVRGEFGGWDYSGYRTGFLFEADGTQIKTSVNGVAAVARAAALTAEIPGDATRDELRLTELYNACKAFGIIN